VLKLLRVDVSALHARSCGDPSEGAVDGVGPMDLIQGGDPSEGSPVLKRLYSWGRGGRGVGGDSSEGSRC